MKGRRVGRPSARQAYVYMEVTAHQRAESDNMEVTAWARFVDGEIHAPGYWFYDDVYAFSSLRM